MSFFIAEYDDKKRTTSLCDERKKGRRKWEEVRGKKKSIKN